tara:strand:- start:98 stop:328 length:231 start_codon:yes stop_codon:yes gene_type:complete
MRFTYQYEEWSQDTRSFEIESEVKLTESEIAELSTEVSFTDGETSSGDTYKITFKGTKYGENTEFKITGDDVKEED